MTQEEKYEEAKRLYETANADQRYVLESLFPELKESEDDEKVRKALIELVKYAKGNCLELLNKPFNVVSMDAMLAWLEKQGEQKPVDKVEPFDEFEELTDFERTLADICIGWIGEEFGWKQYIKDNADVLLKIAVEKFNSVQDVPFEQKPAWSKEDEKCYIFILSSLEEKYSNKGDVYNWFKSLKQRIGP